MVEGIHDEGAGALSDAAVIVRAAVKGGKCYRNEDGKKIWNLAFPKWKRRGEDEVAFSRRGMLCMYLSGVIFTGNDRMTEHSTK